jgi:hypothetical protein
MSSRSAALRSVDQQSKVVCDGLSTQNADTHQKLAAPEGADARLAAVPDHGADIEARHIETRRSVAAIQSEQDAATENRRPLAELHESSAVLFVDITGRLDALQSIQGELERAERPRDALYQHLTQIQNLEGETFERHREAEQLLDDVQ